MLYFSKFFVPLLFLRGVRLALAAEAAAAADPWKVPFTESLLVFWDDITLYSDSLYDHYRFTIEYNIGAK